MKKRFTFFSLIFFAILLSAFIFFDFSAYAVSAENVGSSAEGLCVLEVSSGRILYEKNAYKPRPMASTTKILTAITVIENAGDLDKIHAVPKSAVGVEGSSIYLEEGEELSVKDLLYGLMLQSGNDCAEALAIITSKSLTEFAALMNKTAKKIGAKNSNFVTPHGLHDDNHYTTAYDLALISSYALKNPVFKQIAASKRHTTPWKGRNYNRVILNKNKLLSSFEGCDGVKTGYTKKAGRCYVSSATRNGMQVVAAVLNCGPMFEECASFMTKAFNEYEMTEILKPKEKLAEAAVLKGKKETVEVGALESVKYPLKKGERENLNIRVEIDGKLEAPVSLGLETGKIKISLQNNLLFEEKLYTIEGVLSKDVIDRLKDLAYEWTK